MARNRMIKVEFWSDEAIGQISPLARLLFIGLWNFADDQGKITANPVFIRSNIFPYDHEIDVHGLLKELEENLFLFKYKVGRNNFYYIRNFCKHQKIDRPNLKNLNPDPDFESEEFKTFINPEFSEFQKNVVETSSNDRRMIVDERENENEKEIEIRKQREQENNINKEILENSSSSFSKKDLDLLKTLKVDGKRLLEQHGKKDIENALSLTRTSKAKNPAAYFMAALKNGWQAYDNKASPEKKAASQKLTELKNEIEKYHKIGDVESLQKAKEEYIKAKKEKESCTI